MTPIRRETLRRILGCGWICALAFSLLVAAQNCYREIDRVTEYAYACDAFGYLTMAREIRQAAANREQPNFQIESPQIRLLIDFMRSRKVPTYLWNEMVAPHAHHYFPESGHVGVQYPPGAGLALAVFPEGEALHRLNIAVISLIVATGIIGLGIAALRAAWISAGCLILALEVGLQVLERIGGQSFSVNAGIGPLLLSLVLVFAVIALEADARTERVASAVAFMPGAFLGFGILTRIAVILLAPGCVWLLCSAPWRKSLGRKVLPFATGLMLVGIIPILAEQSQVAGAWYLSTYGPSDAAPPSLTPVLRNILYYLWDGPGSQDNALLLAIVAGFTGLMLDPRRRNSSRLSARHLALSSALLWGFPTVFFLTHQIAIPYYSVPASFGVALMLALGSLVIEIFPSQPASDDPADTTGKLGGSLARSLGWIALAIALTPGLIAVADIRLYTEPLTPAAQHSAVLAIPAELTDEHNWVWADMLTGSLRYYGNKTAFKVAFSDPGTRALAYKFVFDRGDRQYVILDSPTMSKMLKEMTQMGARPRFKGWIAAMPYFLINWPSDGPHSITASARVAPPSR